MAPNSVIAVTGLAGRAFSSWQYRDGHMWLRDFLPRDVASCRVMIFGYPSQLFKSISEAGLFEYTNYFLQQLDNIRPADSVSRYSDMCLSIIPQALY